ncbi:hypothetical protein GCM10007301_25710 [Azorhizobium oxalatiphilum]|uniref:DUF72 domain-containing protein n=1 Tax=Azorhizobium oxalatiphilum TaxID=980631 RepID=A0A917BZA1_9HYPH|nr:DUF72 domain-containing protein [Azorhizobium oxalatiphilum]GGF64773.1 hypothetical protein GCM10007301_25710 [Azorhizobium oxalatiphilum]
MTIRVGIGGWTFEPWRGTFFPKGLPHARELEHASRQVTSIEVNGTFYRSQTPKTFASWAAQVPDDFVFSLKAPRYATNRRVLAEAGESIARFVDSGLAELGDKLGPINWQFPPTKQFDPEDFGAFLALLPETTGGVALRHAVEVRHASFCTADFIALARKHKVAVIFADDDDYPAIADVTADFVYARLQRAKEEEPNGYSDAALKTWHARAKVWEGGGVPDDLPSYGEAAKGAKDKEAKDKGAKGKKKRDVFVYMINGAKVRAPAAAQALLTLV